MAAPTKAAQAPLQSSEENLEVLGFHRGAIDQTTITTQPPSTVMKQVNAILHSMGVEIQEESTFKYRCIRAKKDTDQFGGPQTADRDSLNAQSHTDGSDINPPASECATESGSNFPCVLYGSPSDDSMDEVRFSVELTRLTGLSGTYSLDIRRLKGNLRSYGFIYNTIRE
ncbi:hypothetical protein BDZ97DRAFT_1797949 [Flammula alnicola]|nr:hypothetical protein BDZ97DRAFT_1797949 [Flammula alnicola]